MIKKSLDDCYQNHKDGNVSDKWSIYIREYDRIFFQFQELPVSTLEIGVQNGGSLDIFSEYFINAKNIIGCDINKKCSDVKFNSSKINLVIGDINSKKTRENILKIANEFDIIIDDGSHQSQDIIETFLFLFVFLKYGGVYIIEDLHCSYWQEFHGGLHHPNSSISFFKALIDIINHEHWGIKKSIAEYIYDLNFNFKIDNHILDEIHSIEFINSLCVITKQEKSNNLLGKRHIVGKIATVEDNKNHNNEILSPPLQFNNRYSYNSSNHSIQTTITLYWQGINNNRLGYDEARSSRVTYDANKEKQEVHLRLQGEAKKIEKLRLDISDCPIIFELYAIKILSGDTDVIWVWDKKPASLTPLHEAFIIDDKSSHLVLASLGIDPSLQLNVPPTILEKITTDASIFIEFKASSLTDSPMYISRILNAFSNFLGRETSKIFTSTDQINIHFSPDFLTKKLGHTLDLLQKLHEENKIARTKKGKDKSDMLNELLRAEAQLELLKHII